MTNGYIAFYRGKRVEVHAETQYAATDKAEAEFKKLFPRARVQRHMMSVLLAEVGTHGGTKKGEQVTHLPLM